MVYNFENYESIMNFYNYLYRFSHEAYDTLQDLSLNC